MLWVYVGLLVLLLGLVIAGQLAYQRTFGHPESPGAKTAFVIRSVNIGLVVVAIIGVIAYLLVKA